jgi:hypothetical protein
MRLVPGAAAVELRLRDKKKVARRDRGGSNFAKRGAPQCFGSKELGGTALDSFHPAAAHRLRPGRAPAAGVSDGAVLGAHGGEPGGADENRRSGLGYGKDRARDRGDRPLSAFRGMARGIQVRRH